MLGKLFLCQVDLCGRTEISEVNKKSDSVTQINSYTKPFYAKFTLISTESYDVTIRCNRLGETIPANDNNIYDMNWLRYKKVSI